MSEYNFTETPNTTGKVIDTITLTANEYLSFPTFFIDKHRLKERGTELYAKMFYDAQKKAVAIQFTPEKNAGLYKVNFSPQYGATCKIRSFLRNNEIDTETFANKYEYKKFPASELGMEGSDIFVVNLKRREESE